MEIMGLPSLVAIIYLIIEIYKSVVPKEKEIWYRLIPVIAGVLGIIFGIIAFYVVPEMMPNSNIFSAIMLGIVSGLSATGTNQILKQFAKKANESGKVEETTKTDMN